MEHVEAAPPPALSQEVQTVVSSLSGLLIIIVSISTQWETMKIHEAARSTRGRATHPPACAGLQGACRLSGEEAWHDGPPPRLCAPVRGAACAGRDSKKRTGLMHPPPHG